MSTRLVPFFVPTILASLLASSAFAAAPLTELAKQKPVTIATTVKTQVSLAPGERLALTSAGQTVQKVISHADAAFIKVHFSAFKLPAGAYVTVASSDGREKYTYNGSNQRHVTFDRSKGEDGISKFSAMSVFGDRAVVTLFVPAGVHWDSAQHKVEVSEFNAGSDKALDINGLVPESTCGNNERKDAVCFATSDKDKFERTRPVGRLYIGGSGLCTTWRVGESNFLFTNNHCFSTQDEVTNSEVWFNYQNTTCGGSTLANVVKVTAKTLFKTDATLDYSLFSVNDFANISSFGYFGLDVRTPVQGEQIFIPQHGAGNPKELAITSDQNPGGLCQIDVAITNGNGTNTDTGYKCDTIGGSSGSPVVANNSKNVLALHHLGGCPSATNSGVLIQQIWPQVSSFFNNVVPVGDNGKSNGNKPPVAALSANCTGLACQFSSTGSSDPDGTIAKYEWQFGDGQTATGASVSHTYAAAGKYTATLKVTDNTGASASKSQDVTVAATSTAKELQSGVAVGSLSAAAGQSLSYFIQTKEANTTVKAVSSAGTGNADLYVKVGAEPTATSYDCRSNGSSNAETCSVTVPAAGRVYIKLIATSAFANASLVATNSVVSTGGFPKTNLSAAKGAWLRYQYVVPAGKTSVTVTSANGTGDGDLYVGKGVDPTRTSYTCHDIGTTNSGKCVVTTKPGETLRLGVYGYAAFSGLTLDVK